MLHCVPFHGVAYAYIHVCTYEADEAEEDDESVAATLRHLQAIAALDASGAAEKVVSAIDEHTQFDVGLDAAGLSLDALLTIELKDAIPPQAATPGGMIRTYDSLSVYQQTQARQHHFKPVC